MERKEMKRERNTRNVDWEKSGSRKGKEKEKEKNI